MILRTPFGSMLAAPLLAAALLLSAAVLPATAVLTSEDGLPAVQFYGPEAFGGPGQCLDAVLAKDGPLFVANFGGILEFDGSRWQTVKGTKDHPFLALGMDDEGRIWGGTLHDAGVLLPDERGELSYHSVFDAWPDSLGPLGQVWRIRPVGEEVILQTPRQLVRYRPAEGNLLEGAYDRWEGRYYMAVPVEGSVWVKRAGQPLEHLVGDSLVTADTAGSTRPLPLTDATPFRDGILFTGFGGEMVLLSGGGYTPFRGEVADLVAGRHIFGCTALGDGRYGLATQSLGIVVFDEEGRVLEQLDAGDGLASSGISRSPRLDASGGVWAPMDYGVTRLGLNTPFRYHGTDSGLDGSLMTMEWLQDVLYIGTTTGLYRRVPGEAPGEEARFEPVGETGLSYWTLHRLGDGLVAGTTVGLKLIGADGSVRDHPGVRSNVSLLVPAPDGRHLYCDMGNDQLHLLRIQGEKLHHVGPAGPAGMTLNALSLGPEGGLWAAAMGPEGIQLLHAPFDKADPANVQFEALGIEEGIESDLAGPPFVWRDRLFVATAERGLLVRDPAGGGFVPAGPALGLEGEVPIAQSALPASEDQLYFADSDGEIYLITPEEAPELRLQQPLKGADVGSVNLFGWDRGENKVLVALEDGRLLSYDPAGPRMAADRPRARIAAVVLAADSLLYGGYGVPGAAKPQLEHTKGNLRFRYALASFHRPGENRFRYRLLGQSSQWSDWTAESYRDFTNLPEGRYTFELQGRDSYGRASDTASWTFIMRPPWYRSAWAWTLWILLAGLLVYGIVRWRVWRVERQKRRLEELVEQRTEELRRAQEAKLKEIEARKAAEVEAQKLSTVTKLTAAISHEFNNPLAVMQGRLDIIRTGRDKPENLPLHHDSLRSQVEKMRDLVLELRKLDSVREVDYAAGLKMLDLHQNSGELRSSMGGREQLS